MEEIVKLVVQKTGLPEEQARAATQTVLDYLMTRLPPPVAEQIKMAMGGNLGDAAKGIQGMFGKK